MTFSAAIRVSIMAEPGAGVGSIKAGREGAYAPAQYAPTNTSCLIYVTPFQVTHENRWYDSQDHEMVKYGYESPGTVLARPSSNLPDRPRVVCLRM
jgi:hypothetical protein